MTTLTARVATQVRSVGSARLVASLAGIVAASLLLGWILAERGPAAAFLPFAACAAAAVAAATMNRPLYGVLALVAVVSAFPVARVEVGSVPVYMTDVLAALALAAVFLQRVPRTQFNIALGIYLLAWIPAWIYQVIKTGLFLQPTYGLIRSVLAVAVAIPVAAAIRRHRSAELFLIVLALGTIISALLALAQVIPGLQGYASDLLSTLAPNFTPAAYQVYPDRAFSLFTAPTALSGYLAVALPVFIAGMSIVTRDMRRVLIFAIALSVLALIATYSRQWAPALAIGLFVLVLVQPRALRRTVLIAAAGVLLVGVAFSSGVLSYGYFGERFGKLGADDENVQLRLERQREFFAVSGADVDTLVGRGFAGQDIAAQNLVDSDTTEALRRGVSDNSFLLEFFNHGIVAGCVYIAILIGVLQAAIREARRRSRYSTLLSGLVASLLTAVALHFFDRYFSEAVFMKMLFWMLIGFTLAVIRLARLEAAQRVEGVAEPAQ